MIESGRALDRRVRVNIAGVAIARTTAVAPDGAMGAALRNDLRPLNPRLAR